MTQFEPEKSMRLGTQDGPMTIDDRVSVSPSGPNETRPTPGGEFPGEGRRHPALMERSASNIEPLDESDVTASVSEIVPPRRSFACTDGSRVFESGSSTRGRATETREGAARHYSIRVVPAGWVRDWGSTEQPTPVVYPSGEGSV